MGPPINDLFLFSQVFFFFVLDVEDGGRTGTGDLRGLPQVMGGEAGLQQLRL